MTVPDDLADELADETVETLEHYGFDGETFRELRQRYLDGDFGPRSNTVEGEVEAPDPDDIDVLPGRESVEGRRLIDIGREVIREGKVGLCMLNGGMATRFGGAVKGCVEVFGGRSFLELKLSDVERWDGDVEALVMNSFNTDEATREHLEEGDWFGCDPEDVRLFDQGVSLRLEPDGSLFREEDGRASLYAPGHGDLRDALVDSGTLEAFREQGGEYILMSNVDNLLATVDPWVVGAHVKASRSGAEMTVEVVSSEIGDTGGKPARVDDNLQIVEWFRFPESFPKETIPVHNTNNLLFDADALERDFSLGWYVVEKEVEGQTAIQFERLVGELSDDLETHMASVPRDGEWSRYQPIKTREDLADNRDYLRRALESRDVV